MSLTKWSNRCDLCCGTRVSKGSGFRGLPDLECTWCKAVRMKYGSYWYPVKEKSDVVA